MYEDLAWENFCKTGNLESYIEYNKICEINNQNIGLINDEGIILDELDKGKRDSN